MNTVIEVPSPVLINIVLPLSGRGLLVPNTAVAEVVLAGQLSSAVSSPFLLGYTAWRDQDIPLISFDGLLNGHLPAGLAWRQIAILHGITDRQKMPFFGLVLSAAPRLVRMRNSDIIPMDTEVNPLIHSQVRAADLKLMIPDWHVFEQKIMAAL
jgi:chemosensory pili system protein ChpC